MLQSLLLMTLLFCLILARTTRRSMRGRSRIHQQNSFRNVCMLYRCTRDYFHLPRNLNAEKQITCSCRELNGACFRNYRPVCGTDNVLYYNKCLLCAANGCQLHNRNSTIIGFLKSAVSRINGKGKVHYCE